MKKVSAIFLTAVIFLCSCSQDFEIDNTPPDITDISDTSVSATIPETSDIISTECETEENKDESINAITNNISLENADIKLAEPLKAGEKHYLDGADDNENSYRYISYNLSYPQFESEIYPQTAEKMNKYYYELFESDNATMLNDYTSWCEELNNVDVTANFFPWYQDKDFYVTIGLANKYLTVMIYNESYFGGVHPSHNTSYNVFDITNSEKMTFNSLFSVDREIYMHRLCEEIYTELTKITDYKEIFWFGSAWLDNDNREKVEMEELHRDCNRYIHDNTFFLTNSGLNILFNEYEIATYAYGSTLVEIPYERISDILIDLKH